MKKVYLVGRINEQGFFTGSLSVFSSLKKAEEYRDESNSFFNTFNFVIEKHLVDNNVIPAGLFIN